MNCSVSTLETKEQAPDTPNTVCEFEGIVLSERLERLRMVRLHLSDFLEKAKLGTESQASGCWRSEVGGLGAGLTDKR